MPIRTELRAPIGALLPLDTYDAGLVHTVYFDPSDVARIDSVLTEGGARAVARVHFKSAPSVVSWRENAEELATRIADAASPATPAKCSHGLAAFSCEQCRDGWPR